MALPLSVALSCSDMDDMPDDGHRYELIDGVLVVSPAPSVLHQVVSANLVMVLGLARPPGVTVLAAPVDYRHEPDVSLQPDVVVVPAAHAAGKFLTDPPWLVVEILSHSTRSHDLGTKLLTYARLGVPTYWTVDPDEPGIIARELDPQLGRYVETGRAAGHQPYEAGRPYRVTIVPADLLVP